MAKTLRHAAYGVLVLVAAAATDVAAGPQSKCLVSKNKCVAKKAGSLLKCEEKAETPGKPMDPNFADCEDKAKEKFDGGSDPTKGCFEKLENKTPNDCVTVNDTASLEAKVENCVDQLVAAIDPAPLDQSKCNVSKKKCAAKKLKSVLKCYQKAETPGKPNDPNADGCLDKAMAKFDGGVDPTKGCFAKLESKTPNDCLAPFGNTATVEGIVDSSCAGAFVAALENPTSTTTSTTSTTTSTTSSTTTSTTSSTTTSTTSTTTSTTSSTTTSSTTTSTTSSTTTSTTSTTTSTTIVPTKFSFTNAPGTTNCGGITSGVTFSPAASAPFSGEIDSDLACTAKIADLGLGCLYIGGGGATTVPPGGTPDHATNIFDISGTNLVASNGTSNLNCTKGAGPGKHCIAGTNTGMACTLDSNCGGLAGSCALDANCFFAAPLPIPNGSLSTCVVNVVQTDASGTIDVTTGASSTAIPLSSRVYITANAASPCPKCVSGTCTAGLNMGLACSAGGNTLGTSQDCPPLPANFLSPLAVSLSPLTTGAVSKTGAAGNFCPSPPAPAAQLHNGAFGKTNAQCIKEAGSPGGDLRNGLPHPAKLASVFCIPKTGNVAIDPAADLPGPGAFSITGNAQGLP